MPGVHREALTVALTYVAVALSSILAYFIVRERIVRLSEPAPDAKWRVLGLQLFLYLGIGPAVIMSKITPLPGLAAGMVIVIFSLKIHSYCATNFLMALERAMVKAKSSKSALSKPAKDALLARHPGSSSSLSDLDSSDSTSSSKDRSLRFPASVNFPNFAYFMFCAPTLTYETRYPRTGKVRKVYVIEIVAEMFICFAIQYCISVQLLLPPLRNPSTSLVFDMMRLAIPSIIVWLLGFYAFFHAFLNGWAELAQFADRQFYLEWWNSTTIEDFWSTWNLLVHEWCLRHVFVESQSYLRVSKRNAGLATFLISAILHEYIFFIGFRSPRPAIFTAMMIQVPLMSMSQQLKRRGLRRGNLLVWLNLFLGQPLVELMYVRSVLDRRDPLFPCER
eukprot:CAMPEP_0184688996 /NCGR_PEP_ID=MMETSP0312-20130426/30404_1 /TAXON_ID=31354 /ORGANISM="Compsopogon coeruleus, Strain SAG 36.94" /LENGTH=391 /DNA_ID=CAMNT_0027146281 /DNA_START=571 /DNA_END=1747 /DNA_ORIENTATION=-